MPIEEMREKIEEFIKNLISAVRLNGLYGHEHKLTKESVEKSYRLLENILLSEKEVTIGVIGKEIAFREKPFYEMSRQIKGFIEDLKKMKAEKITFLSGVTKEEVMEFIAFLAVRMDIERKDKHREKKEISFKANHIRIGRIGADEEISQEDREKIKAVIEKNYKTAVDFLEKTSRNIKEKQPIDGLLARQLVSNMIGDALKNIDLLLALASVKGYDESTFVHDINVAIFTLIQAEALGIDKEYLNDIGIAALLHDTGKLLVSGDILRKKEKLTEEEWHEITLHPINGAKLLLEAPDIPLVAAIAAFEHHMLYDSSGYPKRYCGAKCGLASMMITIADYYDALRSKRHYRDELKPEETYENMMELSGRYFEPRLLENFFKIIGVYPPGTLVELDTKEVGIVVKHNPDDIKRPQIKILYNSQGEKENDSYLIDLSDKDENDKYKHNIIKSVISSEYGEDSLV
ncbi:MAG: HD domain-containing phosphohydrolase [Candidatus Omnitrophota bacterium]